MRTADYDSYLTSDAWKAKRYQRLGLDGFSCQGCGATGSLDVHHRHYVTLGSEDMTDLVSVCRFCHDEIHRVQRASGFPLEEVTKLMLRHLQEEVAVARMTPRRQNGEKVTVPPSEDSGTLRGQARVKLFEILISLTEDAQFTIKDLTIATFGIPSTEGQQDAVTDILRSFRERWPSWLTSATKATKFIRIYDVVVAKAPVSLDSPPEFSEVEVKKVTPPAASPSAGESITQRVEKLESDLAFLEKARVSSSDGKLEYVTGVATPLFNTNKPRPQRRLVLSNGESGLFTVDDNTWSTRPLTECDVTPFVSNGARE